jgi:uncharacterized cupin superfamily protein
MKHLVTISTVLGLFVPAGHAETLQPSKLNGSDLTETILDRLHRGGGNGDDDDNETYLSPDRQFETGLYSSGPIHEVIEVPGGYPNAEFLYLLSGEITLTSQDGRSTTVNSGEAVTIPKGWIGQFDSSSYVKLYAIYYPDGMPR